MITYFETFSLDNVRICQSALCQLYRMWGMCLAWVLNIQVLASCFIERTEGNAEEFRYPDRYFSRDSSPLTTEYTAYYHCIAILHIVAISLLCKPRNILFTELCLMYAKCEHSNKLFPILSRVSGSVRMFLCRKKCLFYSAPPCSKQSLMSETTLKCLELTACRSMTHS